MTNSDQIWEDAIEEGRDKELKDLKQQLAASEAAKAEVEKVKERLLTYATSISGCLNGYGCPLQSKNDCPEEPCRDKLCEYFSNDVNFKEGDEA